MRDEPGLVVRIRCDARAVRRAMHTPHVEIRPDGPGRVVLHSREIDARLGPDANLEDLAAELRALAVDVVPALRGAAARRRAGGMAADTGRWVPVGRRSGRTGRVLRSCDPQRHHPRTADRPPAGHGDRRRPDRSPGCRVPAGSVRGARGLTAQNRVVPLGPFRSTSVVIRQGGRHRDRRPPPSRGRAQRAASSGMCRTESYPQGCAVLRPVVVIRAGSDVVREGRRSPK